MSDSFWDHPIASIEKALQIRKQIESLQSSLSSLMGNEAPSTKAKTGRRGRPPKAAPVVSGKVDGRKKPRSAAVRAKMAAAAKARWAAKKTGDSTSAAPVVNGAKKKRRKMSPEARARIAAAQKARWAKQKSA